MADGSSVAALTVVLVHGGFVDGSGWEGVYQLLRWDGSHVRVGQHPTDSLADDVAARHAALAEAQLDPKAMAEGQSAVAGQRIGVVIDAGMKFHHGIYAASGNPLIAETVNHHRRHIRRAMGTMLQTAGVRRAVWDEHEAILHAINRGDADRAERLAREHCERAGQHIVAQLTRHVRHASRVHGIRGVDTMTLPISGDTS